jgi:hypothetical protein
MSASFELRQKDRQLAEAAVDRRVFQLLFEEEYQRVRAKLQKLKEDEGDKVRAPAA